jgi:site-specific recombinase XerD
MRFTGIDDPGQFRVVTRAHVLAWRRDLEARALSGATIRRKLAAPASLFPSLCEENAVTHNPVGGVKRPKISNQEGKTPAIGDHHARALWNAPGREDIDGLKNDVESLQDSTNLKPA